MTREEQISKLNKDLENTKSKILRQEIRNKIKALEDNKGIQK